MKRWNVPSEYNPKQNFLSQLVKLRGVENFKESLDLPVELKKSLKEAKTLVEKIIKAKKEIIIFGDYDADGISSTAILYKTLKSELGHDKTFYFIPNRFEHGYGLSKDAIDFLLEKRPASKGALFITVDTGVTANNEVAYLKKLGFKVIIIDHHQKPKKLPKANCIVWYDKVVAAMLAWLFCRALGSKDRQSISLVALATVTDLQPILGLNRTIVKKGLEVLNTNPITGIKELLKAAGRVEGEITTYDLGWIIGPRLNASGRLVDAQDSFLLLTEKDPEKVKEIAQKLNNLNSERQDKTLEMYEIAAVYKEGNLPKIIFSENENYHEGVIGLVAAKLVQKFYRPAVVISLTEEYGKGSVRSVKGVDIISFLRRFEDLFTSLGGHPMAAGFSIKRENISVLKERALAIVDEHIKDELLIPEINIDMKIPIELVNLNLVNTIEKLKPFGLGNEEPVFLAEDLGIAGIDKVGKENKHIKLKLYRDGKYYKAIYFDGIEGAKDLKFGDKVDVVFTVKKNEYNGSTYVDLVIKDLKKESSL